MTKNEQSAGLPMTGGLFSIRFRVAVIAQVP